MATQYFHGLYDNAATITPYTDPSDGSTVSLNVSTTFPAQNSSVTDDFYDYTTDSYFFNSTDIPVNATHIPPSDSLILAYNIMVAVNSAFITLSMGAGVHPAKVLPHIKRPYGPLIGVLCQSIIMPALCFGYSVLLDLAPAVAIGMIITGSCPGGALSNIFTFWSRGNLTLSVSMTVFSTTLSIGFMPLNMFIYTRYWMDEDNPANIPYVNMVISIGYTWVAVLLGMLIAWKLPKVAKYVVRIGSGLGFAFMIVVGVLQNEIYGGTGLFNVGGATWAGAMIMPFVGFFIGFVISSICCQKLTDKKAIAYETGTQNVAVALSVIALSVDDIDLVGQISPVPMIYAFSQIVVGVGCSFIHQLYYRSKEDRCPFRRCAKDGDTDPEESSPQDLGNTNLGYELSEARTSVDMDPDPGGTRHPGTSTSPPVVSMLDPSADIHNIQLQLSDDSET